MRRWRTWAVWAVFGAALLPAQAWAEEAEKSFAARVDDIFGEIVSWLGPILFWEPSETVPIPLIVMVLVFGALFFTFYHRFLNFRGLRHSIDVVRGRYDNPDDPGEISHLQALTSALSATIGLGNIAGVAVAVWTGGPGAVFWMLTFGFFGMCAKLHECTLGQLYRQVDTDGTVHGGPMYYLRDGLAQQGLPRLGKVLAAIFVFFCIVGSFGGGNMFQANQAYAAMAAQLPILEGPTPKLLFGLGLAFMVGLVIIGGIKSIGRVTEKVIPFMCGVYLLAGLVVLVTNFSAIPAALARIFTEAFNPDAMYGGFIGVLIQGVRRAAFSNEAGIGSAAIAHSAAKTDEPVREGMVAMLGPMIDTVIICTMTAVILVVTGAYGERAQLKSAQGPFEVRAGQTLELAVDGKAPVTVTFGRYAETGRALVAGYPLWVPEWLVMQGTPEELARAIEQQVDTVRVAATKDGRISVESTKNTSIAVVGGSARGTFGFPEAEQSGAGLGVEMTRWAFGRTMSWFPWVLAVSILLFAFSTMISWSYYGERAWNYAFGRSQRATLVYRSIFLVFVVVGTLSALDNVITFSDLMLLSMAFPNIIGGLLLARVVRKRIVDYWGRYQRDEFTVYK